MTMIAATPLPIGVFGPASSTDNAVARFDGADGRKIQGSGVIINDSDEMGVGRNPESGYQLTINEPDVGGNYKGDAVYITDGTNHLRFGLMVGGHAHFYSDKYLKFETASNQNIQYVTNAFVEYNAHMHMRDNKILDLGDGHDVGLKYDSVTDTLQIGLASYASLDTPDIVVGPAGAVGIGAPAPSAPTAAMHIDSDILRLEDSKTPASAGAAGNAGDICWDSDYVYICVAANTWKRAAIATW